MRMGLNEADLATTVAKHTAFQPQRPTFKSWYSILPKETDQPLGGTLMTFDSLHPEKANS